MRTLYSSLLSLCLLAGGASTRASAGQVYTFTLERHEGVRNNVRTGRVLVDGDRYRLELDPEAEPRPFDALISTGPDAGEIGLDLAGRTYYKLEPPDPSRPMTLALWLYNFPDKGTVSKVKVESYAAPKLESLAGLTTRRQEIRASYDLKVRYVAETLHGHVVIEEISWMAEDRSLPLPGLLRTDVHTALPEVDPQLEQARARLRGFPVKTAVRIDIDMGPESQRQIFYYTFTIRDLKPANTPDSLFQVPSGFRYHEPVITRPGVR